MPRNLDFFLARFEDLRATRQLGLADNPEPLGGEDQDFPSGPLQATE